ncbi:hypothetical protein ACFLTH_00280 [Bacteroidota bacterium]
MLKKLPWLFILLLLITSADLHAQRSSSMMRKSKTKGIERRADWDWDWRFNSHSRPMIEMNYGIGKPEHKNIGSKFPELGMAEIKLGFNSVDELYDSNIIDFEEQFFFASNLSTDLKIKKDDDPLTLDGDIWRFGFGLRDGYGYSMGAIALIPYTQYSISWSQLNMKEFPDSTLVEEINILNDYHDSFRFGVSAEAGAKFEIASFISVNAAYEANVIFPRHLFWKHMGSVSLELIGISTIDYFVDELIDSSPAIAPILNVLLKSGFMYGFYHLKKDKMYWPFDSGTLLTYESIKIGTTFVF